MFDNPTQITLSGILLAGLITLWKLHLDAQSRNASEFTKCQEEHEKASLRLRELEVAQAIYATCDKLPCGAKEAFRRQQNFGNHPTTQQNENKNTATTSA